MHFVLIKKEILKKITVQDVSGKKYLTTGGFFWFSFFFFTRLHNSFLSL